MSFLLNSLLFALGMQAGIGFQFGIFIISGNLGYADLLLPICIFLLSTRKFTNLAYQMSSIFILLILILTLSNLIAATSAGLSGSILPVFRIIWLFMFFLIILLSDRNNIKSLILGVSVGITIYALYSYYLYSLAPRTFFGVPYIASKINNANTLGYFMTFGVLSQLILLDIIRSDYLSKIWVFLSILFCSTAGILTMSKTAWLSFMIIFTAYLFVRLKFLRFPAIIFGLVFLTVAFPVIEGRISGSSRSNDQRLNMITSGIDMIQVSPLYGSGHQAYQSLGRQFGVRESDAHNVFVGIGLEYGVIALTLFLIAYFIVPLLAFIRLNSIERIKALPFGLLLVLGALWGMTTGLVFSDKLYILLMGCFLNLYVIKSAK